MLSTIYEAVAHLRKHGFEEPEVGIVLGTGLGKLIEKIEVEHTIAYGNIPNFPVSTVEFHAGKLIYGKIGDKKVVAMQGRFHYYEGFSMQQITFPIRVMKSLGIKYLLLSNAAGGINLDFKKGSLILIDDHINMQPDNPLIGTNYETLGPRFPDMSQPYNPELMEKLTDAAKEHETELKKGVYVSVSGPNLETRAEYRFLGRIGADMVGMSTVPEVIVANHMSLPCAAISVITDECDPDNLKPANINDIITVAGEADEKLSNIFATAIKNI